MDCTNVLQLFDQIGEKNPLQKKYLEKYIRETDSDEAIGFEKLLSYYIDQGETVNSLADLYLDFIEDLMEERYYFVQNDSYRYSSAREVDEKVYQNPEYMKMYMIGLALSTYLLTSHKEYMRWFKEKIKEYSTGDIWLEVGPGHGAYFVQAVNHTEYHSYYGIDLSQTAVDMCKDIIEKQIDGKKNIVIERKDFFELSESRKYDAIVVGEVLEHVENPDKFLEKIYHLSTGDTFIYITTAVNCPQKDHIYLFRSVDEVESMIISNGFVIEDSLYVPTNGYSMEKAMKMKTAINVAYLLKKAGN